LEHGCRRGELGFITHRNYNLEGMVNYQRIVMFWGMNELDHEITVDFNLTFNVVRVYDSSHWVTTPEQFWYWMHQELRRDLLNFFLSRFALSRIEFARMNWNSEPLFSGACTAFSAWAGLYIAFNPEISSTRTYLPPLPGHEAVAFYRFVRACIHAGRIIVPETFEHYIGHGMFSYFE